MALRKNRKSRKPTEPGILRDAEAHGRRGYSSLVLDRLDDAVREFEEALRLNPQNVAALSGLGVAYRRLGCHDEALQQYASALKIKPDYARAHTNLAVTYWHQGRWDEAIHEYEAALRIRPGDAEPHFGLGATYAEQGRIAEAIQQFQVALQIRPDFTDARYNLAAACLQQRLWREAARQFHFILQKIAPDDGGAHLGLGLAYKGLGQLEDAVQQFQVVLLLDPEMGEVHYALAEVTMEQGDLHIALHEAERAFQLGYEPAGPLAEQIRALLPPEPAEQLPEFIRKRLKPALKARAAAKPEKAPKATTKAEEPPKAERKRAKEKREKKPGEENGPAQALDRYNEAQTHFRQAMVFRKQAQWELVIEELEEALRINPSFASAHIELGKVYARTRDWDKAIRQFTDIVRIRPEYATVHFYMGLVYLEQSRWQEAAHKFQTTLDLDGNRRQAQRGLEMAQSHLDPAESPGGNGAGDV